MSSIVVLTIAVALYFIVIVAYLTIINEKLNKLLKCQTDPKKPERITFRHSEYIGECPVCHRAVSFAQKHCSYCTQLLNWDYVLDISKKSDDPHGTTRY